MRFRIQRLQSRGLWALLTLRRLLIRVANALVPSALPLYEMTTGVAQTQLLATLVELKIPQLVAAGPNTLCALSKELKIAPDNLERFLRVACSLELLRRTRGGTYSVTRLGAGLATDAPGSLKAFTQYMASAGNVLAWSNLTDFVRTGTDAFSARGTTVWEHFAANTREMNHFDQGMSEVALLDAPQVARAYPFARHKVLCDVGGGRGTLLSTLLRAHPELQGFVFDRKEVTEAMDVPEDLRERMRWVSGDFFADVPLGADAYILRQILHDWSDKDCIKILRRCARAMRPCARLLIIESCVEHDHPHYLGAIKDLTMGVVCGGRERSNKQMRKVVEQAGLRLLRKWPTASPVLLWETVATPSFAE